MQAISPQSAIRAFIVENLFLGADTRFGNDDPLKAGAIDTRDGTG